MSRIHPPCVLLAALTLVGGSAPLTPSGTLGAQPAVGTQGALATSPLRLSPLEGHSQSEAYAINAAGEVAGSSFDPSPRIAVIWDPVGRPTALAPLAGNHESQAEGINDAGIVVGWSRGADGLQTAVMWGRDREPVELSHLPAHTGSRARDINEGGMVVGQSWIRGTERAIMWRRDGAAIELSRLPGDSESAAFGINAEGSVVGKSQGSSDPKTGRARTAMVWSPDGQATALTPLPGDEESVALAINDAGIVVGESTRIVRGGSTVCVFTAVAWDLDGPPRALAPLSGDADGLPLGECVGIGTDAWSVTTSGLAAGFSVSARSGVLWDLAGNAVALPPLPGDTLSWAYGINPSGAAVGYSQNDSGKTAVVWR